MDTILLSHGPLANMQQVLELVHSASCGAVSSFIGIFIFSYKCHIKYVQA